MQKITDFEVLAEIAKSKYSRVVRAYNNVKNRLSVLKILPKVKIVQHNQAEQVIRERNILTHLTNLKSFKWDNRIKTWHEDAGSKFTVDILSHFHDDTCVYLELECIKGCTLLSQIVANNRSVQAGATFYAAELILALQHLHGNNVVYRDLKPENVMMSIALQGRLKLVDFGNAKILEKGDRTYTSCGTAVYIAPEVLTGEGHDHRVDIWALGILICELISGETPFQAPTVKQVYENISCGLMKFNNRVSKNTKSFCQSIFINDLGGRPTL